MPGNQYELSDISVKYRNEDLGSATSVKKESGMHVSPAKGFILAFLAIAVAVGVGLIVHFAGSGSKVECTCNTSDAGGIVAALEGCKELATGGNTDICTACPSQPGSATCPPTLPAGSVTTTAGTTSGTGSTAAPPVIDVRLPLSLEPLLYTVELQPNMYAPLEPDQFTFSGSVKILMLCRENTRVITLHSNKLNITGSIRVTEENGVSDLYDMHEFDLERQFLKIHTSQDMVAGRNYSVDVTAFVGPLVADLAGLYLSSYTRGNETVHIATTQMQPTDARKTFPCYDEPAIKAEFDVTLVRKSHMTSIANMPLDGTPENRYLATTLMAPIDARKALPCFDEPGLKAEFDITLVRKEPKVSISNMPLLNVQPRGDDWFADKFQRTPKMSTYLLAFIICDFDYLENTTKNGVTYRAWSRPEAINQAPYSLQVGVEILDYFEEYFNVTYPLPKQDMIAIPDFAAGAMENWGLITYRETAMLYEPGVSSEGNKQRVAIVVSHELAHQWFGNLVTPSWWDDLWLNEGFASYVEYMGVDFVHPDWKMFEQFVVIDLQDVFNFDGLISSHPVYVPVAHPDEINEIFDRISYGKGASIIRMMRFFLGDNTFQKGLTKYLRQLAYGAAFHDDLWFALGNQSIADNNAITDVKGVMDTWTLQMNYPVVMVTFDRQGQITLKQSRYLRDPNATDPGIYQSPFDYKWDIPFTFTTSSEMNFNVTSADVKLMSRTSGEIMISDQNIPAATGNNWVIGNPMQYGYYRVNYDVRNWNALIGQLKRDHTIIHPINRAQIINDAWNLARSGELEMTTALQTTEYLDMEREYVPWSAASTELAFVRSMLERNPLYGSYQKFMQDKTSSVFTEITMNNTGATHLQSYIRSLISSLACTYGIQECIDESKTLFARWMSNPQENPIDPGLKSTVYCTAIAEGGVAEWEFALAQYKSANLAAEKSRLQSALACTKETWILIKYLEMTINPDEIRRQDAVSAMVSIARNTIGRHLAWSFFVSNWDFLLNDFGAGSFAFSSLVGGLTSSYNSQLDYDELTAFINSKDDLGSGQRAFAQALEKTQSNINWMETNVPVIESWLREQGY